jgi:hypothetical protein
MQDSEGILASLAARKRMEKQFPGAARKRIEQSCAGDLAA